MILIIDNYDSFTYNLFQQISMLGKDVKVVRNDAITKEEIQKMAPEAIVLSPGPGTPAEAGITVNVIKELYRNFPILGICLGHQSIGYAFGANIVQAQTIMHGKLSPLQYEPTGLFAHLDGVIQVMRYHSLVIEEPSLHSDFNIIATASDDEEIMAIQHKKYHLYGLQFHPESIGTKEGSRMMQAFFESIA